MIHQSRKFATTHSSFQTSPRWFSIVITALLPVSIISSLPTHPGKVQHGRHSKLNLERRTLLLILEFSGSSLLFTYFCNAQHSETLTDCGYPATDQIPTVVFNTILVMFLCITLSDQLLKCKYYSIVKYRYTSVRNAQGASHTDTDIEDE